jgi:uncharacterized protein YggE
MYPISLLRTTLSFLFGLFFFLTSWGQSEADPLGGRPYIDVTGVAEKEVVPDEIYIRILIRERQNNKEKITIAQQEEKLRTALTSIGVDLANLYLSDANADFIKIKRKPTEVVTQQEYTLKVATATQVGLVFQQLDRLEIIDAGIARVSHSQLDSLKKEIKIAAIKAAKKKADYLLAALGEQTGKPLHIFEIEIGFMPMVSAVMQSPKMEKIANVSDEASGVEELQFNKIKLEARIGVKFAIK